MEMERGEKSNYWLKLMIETAKEELEILESNYPNQFEFFKTELKSFIPLQNDLPTSSIATQASTSGMKRKRNQQGFERSSTGEMKRKRLMKEDERVEIALEKAKECLQKIHELKISFGFVKLL